ncbi:MAG: tetratricopeptide repeat protein [Flavobacteriales bacterium]
MGRTSFVSIRNSDTHAKGAPRLLGLGLLLAMLFVANLASAQTSENSEPTIGYAAQAKALMVQDPDSALVLALLAEGQLEHMSGIAQRVDVLLVLGDAQLTAEDMPAAMHAFQRAQLLVEEALEADGPDPTLALSLSDVHVKVGVLHFHMREYEKIIARDNAALQVLEGVYDSFSKEELALRKVRLFNNIAGVYIQRSDFDTALRYYQQAIAMNEPLKDLRNEGTLNNNVGICQMELGRHDLAALYFLKALAVRKELGDARGQAQVLNNLGKNQALVGHFGAARQHFEQALELGRELGSRESMVISLESLSSVYDTLGEYKTALLTYKEFKALNDSLYSVESKATIARLEESFRREKEKKVFELEAKRKDAENARQRLWNIALAGALFFVLLTAFLLFKVMRARVRNSTLEQEKLRLEGEKLEAEQDHPFGKASSTRTAS